MQGHAIVRGPVGIWIDHREAILVFPSHDNDELVRISADAESQPRRSGSPPTGPYEAQLVQADDSRDRRYAGLLARYYDEVVERVAGSAAVFVFGPGEAKGELLKRLEASRPGCAVSAEASARLTIGQMVHRVRAHFQGHIPPGESRGGTRRSGF